MKKVRKLVDALFLNKKECCFLKRLVPRDG